MHLCSNCLLQEEEHHGSQHTSHPQVEDNESRNPHEISNKRGGNGSEGREKSIAPKRTRKGYSSSREEEAYNILKNACQRDDCSTYGEHVANELRNLSSRARIMVKHVINNALFEAAMGKYDVDIGTSHVSTPLYDCENSSCGTESMSIHTASSTASSTPFSSNYNYTVLPSEPSEISKQSANILSFPVLSEYLNSNSEKLT